MRSSSAYRCDPSNPLLRTANGSPGSSLRATTLELMNTQSEQQEYEPLERGALSSRMIARPIDDVLKKINWLREQPVECY